MAGSVEAGKLECPECGKDAGFEKRLKKNHCRWWPMVVAVVLVFIRGQVSCYDNASKNQFIAVQLGLYLEY